MKTQKVTLAFGYEHNDFVARIIKKLTRSKYSHSAIIIGDVWVTASLKHGAITKKLEPLKDTYDYIEIEVPRKYSHEAVEFINNNHSGQYDFIGAIVGNLMGISLINQYDDYFCSELVTSVLKHFRSPEVRNIKPISVSPQRLFDLYKHHGVKWGKDDK